MKGNLSCDLKQAVIIRLEDEEPKKNSMIQDLREMIEQEKELEKKKELESKKVENHPIL